MAEKRPLQLADTKWRQNIKTAHLIERLENHALGLVNMEASAVRAAEILLKKTCPDMMQINMDLNHTGAIQIEVLQVKQHAHNITPKVKIPRKVKPAAKPGPNVSNKTTK